MARFNKKNYLRRLNLKRFLKHNNKYIYITLSFLICILVGIYFAYSKFSVSKEGEVVKTTVGNFIYGDIVVGAYINGEYSSTFPKKDDGYKFERVKCDNNSTAEWNNDSWGIVVSNLNERTKCNVYFISDIKVNFNYTGGEQTFIVPVSGTYKLETWGAQGGSSYLTIGGHGGYSRGMITLEKNQKLYVNVGGTTTNINGGYNGGGNGAEGAGDVKVYMGGGGATHIATITGLLSNLENHKSNILIVAGGGGGIYHYSDYYIANGGAAGGYIGNKGAIFLSECAVSEDNAATGGTQSSGGLGNNSSQNNAGLFGKGGDGLTGGGSGYYGGGGTYNVGCSAEGGGGGSSYIGNSLLTNKAMYCYNCEESNEESTKTISTTCQEETPMENCSKKGNGYARITLVSVR